MFEKLISQRTFYRTDTANTFNNIHDILLYFLSNYNNIYLILLILNFNFYRPKDLTITENTIFKVEHQ